MSARPIVVVWIASAMALLLAFLPGLVNWRGFHLAALFQAYDPTVAVLTATLIAVVWYSYFSFQSVRQVELERQDYTKKTARRLASSIMTIRAQVLSLKGQLEFWHKPGDSCPIQAYEVSYVDTEIQQLEGQIISLGPAATVAPTTSQADMDVALVHLRSVRAGLQTLRHALETVEEARLNRSEVSRQVQITIDGLATVVRYLKGSIDKISAFDPVASEEADDYFRDFKSSLESSTVASVNRQKAQK